MSCLVEILANAELNGQFDIISRADRVRIAICSLRTATDIFKKNCCLDEDVGMVRARQKRRRRLLSKTVCTETIEGA